MKSNKKHIPDNIYKDITDNMPICTVDVIFLNKTKDKTLLFKRNNEPVKNVYFTIGGRLFKSEKFLDCAVRQAKRELGIKIDPKKTIWGGVTQDFHKNSVFKGVSYHAVAVFFVHILENEDVAFKFDGQHNDYKWFFVNDKKLHPHIKERIKQTLLVINNK